MTNEGLGRGWATLGRVAGVAAVLMMGFDLVFLGIVARPFYDAQMGPLRAAEVHWPAALGFYLLYVLAISLAAVMPAPRPGEAARRGAALGFFAYAVYELTNWALIAGWPADLVLVDLAWGVVLTGGVAASTHALVGRRLPAYEDWMVPIPAHRFEGETTLTIWGRRLLSFGVVGSLAVVAVAGAPIWLPLLSAADLGFGPRGRWARLRAAAFFMWFLACEVVGLVAAFALWSVTLEGRLISKKVYAEYHFELQSLWSDALFFGALRIFSMRLKVEGADKAAEGPYILWVRHVSTADTVLAAGVLANRFGVRLRYVVKRDLLWDPCLDVVGRRLPVAFVRRNVRDPDAVGAVARLAQDLPSNAGVLIYPEGTRYSEARFARAVERLKENDEPELLARAKAMRNVLPPRLGGVLALMKAAPEADVVTMAHTGLEGARSFREFWSGALVGKTVRVRIERTSSPDGTLGAKKTWVFDRWAEVDDWVEVTSTAEG